MTAAGGIVAAGAVALAVAAADGVVAGGAVAGAVAVAVAVEVVDCAMALGVEVSQFLFTMSVSSTLAVSSVPLPQLT